MPRTRVWYNSQNSLFTFKFRARRRREHSQTFRDCAVRMHVISVVNSERAWGKQAIKLLSEKIKRKVPAFSDTQSITMGLCGRALNPNLRSQYRIPLLCITYYHMQRWTLAAIDRGPALIHSINIRYMRYSALCTTANWPSPILLDKFKSLSTEYKSKYWTILLWKLSNDNKLLPALQ